MKIAIISDTHDNLATLDKFLAYIKQNPVDLIIHCGDIADGITLERIVKNFGGKILVVFGNMDYQETVEKAVKKFPGRIELSKNFGKARLGGLKIGFCHHKENALQYCQSQEFDYMFYGHTHKPWLETVNGCQLANPGTLAGMFYQATFALLDTETKKLELKILQRL